HSILEIAEVFPQYTQGMSKLIDICLIDDKHRRTAEEFKVLRRLLGLETQYGAMIQSPNRDPSRKDIIRDTEAEDRILKRVERERSIGRFDIVYNPVSQTFNVVEIEVNKTHGFGYS